jgi:hypothetical protein
MADRVITTRTLAPRFRNSLTNSADLYAAMPPLTANKICLLIVMPGKVEQMATLWQV